MKNSSNRSLIFTYIYLASSCFALGIGILFLTLFICKYLNIDIFRNLWVLAIPLFLSLLINVFLIELFKKFKQK
jgi:hypothetical protein